MGTTKADPAVPPTTGGDAEAAPKPSDPAAAKATERPKEIGGPPGPEPTRYGDWQFNGRVTDF
jgi:hypothetical protein